MANCEYRVSPIQARENAVSNIKHSVTRKPEDVRPQGAIVAFRDPVELCQVKLDEFNSSPVCELPGYSTQECPIAQCRKGELDTSQANLQLTEIYNYLDSQ